MADHHLHFALMRRLNLLAVGTALFWTAVVIGTIVASAVIFSRVMREVATGQAMALFERELALSTWTCGMQTTCLQVRPTEPSALALENSPEGRVRPECRRDVVVVAGVPTSDGPRGLAIAPLARDAAARRSERTDWHGRALAEAASSGDDFVELVTIGDEPAVRILRLTSVTEACLQCHAPGEFPAGAVVGAAYQMPVQSFLERRRRILGSFASMVGAMWLLGLTAIGFSFTRFRAHVRATQRAELEQQRLESQILRSQQIESLGLLAGGVAHDFNNLLTGVLGNAGLAQDSVPADSPARPHLERIVQAARRSAELAQRLLAYSGRGKLVTEVMDFSAMVREIVELARGGLPKKTEVELALAPPLYVQVDSAQMSQVILNLIANAADAIGDHGGTIRIATSSAPCPPDWTAGAGNGGARSCATLEVTDSGLGMDEKTRARIFEPFFTTKGVGRGLGLAAVQGIVKGHGGRLEVTSAVGRGTSFTVRLPQAASPGEVRAALGAVPRQETRSVQGTVLVVDDEPLVRDLARLALQQYGVEVLTANDGDEALAIARARGAALSVVILDMTMPGKSGQVVLAELHALRPELPVVISSGYHDEEISAQLRDQAVAGFLHKPYLPEEIWARVRPFVEAARPGAEPTPPGRRPV